MAKGGDLLRRCCQALSRFAGPVSLHSPFADLFSGCVDARIAAVTTERYRHSLAIAAKLGAWLVNLRLNYNLPVDEPPNRPGWLEGQVAFWTELAFEAQEADICIAPESMREPDPFLIGRSHPAGELFRRRSLWEHPPRLSLLPDADPSLDQRAGAGADPRPSAPQ
ncbi:MAG: hypothetical protein J7452_03725 [Thermoflexus sp.]|jgi:sugar phosphate isomerase/epimerase|nr:hypothetical protein [Thermoflexus sp.]